MSSNKTSISSSDNARKIEILNRQIENILQKLHEIERSERQVLGEKKEAINTLAFTFEELHKAGVYTQPIDTICAHICKIVRDRGLLASERWVHEVIDDKYKQTKFSPRYEPGIVTERVIPQEAKVWPTETVEGSLWQTPEISTARTDPFTSKKNLLLSQKSIDEMNAEELRVATEQELKEARQFKDIAREKTRRAELMLEKCEEHKIAIDPDIRGREPIPVQSATSAESGPSLFSESLHEYSDIIKRAAYKVEKYKPPAKLDRKFANAINEMILVWRPWVDEKFRKDTLSWLHVQMDEAAHGKHAAATMHSTKFEPDKLLPEETKRALTREQVGDKREIVLQQAQRILSVWKDLVAMHRWHHDFVEMAVAKRAVRLHRRLSESA